MVDNQEKRRWLVAVGVLIFIAVCTFLSARMLSAKLLIFAIFGSGAALLLIHRFVKCESARDTLRFSSVFILLTAVLFINYQTNILYPTNGLFVGFQWESEALALNTIQAVKNGRFQWDSFGLHLGDGSKYVSQIGLQGKFYAILASILSYDQTVVATGMLCSAMTAIVLVGIVFLLRRKYNSLLAGCFYITFLLSPWVVSFARNLYWVEFTWFLPVLFGLLCSIHSNNRKCRVVCYIGVFLSVFVKCACGYEYISTIMLAMIAFLVGDFVKAALDKDKKQVLSLLRTIFIMGLSAVLGFVVAFLIHAIMRGEGNLILGVEHIYKYDIQRRMSVEADSGAFGDAYVASIEAPILAVVRTYFTFTTDVILGIPGGWFMVLVVLPLVVFVYRFIKHKPVAEQFVLYTLFLLATLSWYILAKPHSYIHVHMNYVLWYFGFVQMCLYIVINHVKTVLLERGS